MVTEAPVPGQVQQLPKHKVKVKKEGQRACNEKDEKGKICGGHLKRWFYASDVVEKACGDVEKAWGPDREVYRCENCKALYLPNPTDPSADVDVAAAYTAASRLLATGARRVAEEEVRHCRPRDPKSSLLPDQYIQASPARRMMHDLIEPGLNEGYQPLLAHKEEYCRIAQVLAIMLASSYPEVGTLERLTCTVDTGTANVVLQIADPVSPGELRRVVLVPEAWGDSPGTWLASWLKTYFEERRRMGLLEEGTHTVIHPQWLEQRELEAAVDTVDWNDYPGTYIVEVYTIGGHFRSQRGKRVV
jgi:hypothetical protein